MNKLSDKAKAKKTAYNIEYTKKNCKCKNLQFNKLIPEDIILLNWVNSQTNGTQYIKDLIRADMELKLRNSRRMKESA